jgi:hypothetical protein
MRDSASRFSRWISESGLSRASSTRRRRSFNVTSAARPMRPSVYPVRTAATVFIEHGAMIIPSVRNDPDEIGAACSPGPQLKSASAVTSAGV